MFWHWYLTINLRVFRAYWSFDATQLPLWHTPTLSSPHKRLLIWLYWFSSLVLCTLKNTCTHTFCTHAYTDSTLHTVNIYFTFYVQCIWTSETLISRLSTHSFIILHHSYWWCNQLNSLNFLFKYENRESNRKKSKRRRRKWQTVALLNNTLLSWEDWL